MEIFYVYILYSQDFDKYYTGQTKDLNLRLWYHNNQDKTAFTSKFRPWKIVFSLAFTDRMDALNAERFIKKQKSRVFLLKLIANQRDAFFIKDIFPNSI